MELAYARYPSPLGTLLPLAGPEGLLALAWEEGWDARLSVLSRRLGPLELREEPDPLGAVTALDAYFSGVLEALSRVPLAPLGTPFQLRAWEVLRRIPPGRAWTYGEQARALGRPGAARAVGRANAANPLPLFVPCHRVVPAAGGLGGYSAGVWRKRWLLAHEGTVLPPAREG